MSKTNARFLELDALRGLAAIFVVLFHFTLGRPETEFGFKFGVTGVDLFFILSGFVILLTVEKTKNWKDFLLNRFSRIYPTYWACVTITTIVILIDLKLNNNFSLKILPQYFANMTMFQSYFKYHDIDGSYWTMLIELIFYIYMLFFLISKKTEKIEVFSISLTILLLFYSTDFFRTYFSYLRGTLSYRIPLVNHFPLFCAGIIFYKMKFYGANRIRYCALVFCFFCQIALFSRGGRSNIFISVYEYIPVLFLYFLLFYLYTVDRLKFIVNRITLFLGNISFSLYLIHQVISSAFIIPFLLKYFNFWIAGFITLLLIITLATLINRFIEKPSMNYIRKKYINKPQVKFQPS